MLKSRILIPDAKNRYLTHGLIQGMNGAATADSKL